MQINKMVEEIRVCARILCTRAFGMSPWELLLSKLSMFTSQNILYPYLSMAVEITCWPIIYHRANNVHVSTVRVFDHVTEKVGYGR